MYMYGLEKMGERGIRVDLFEIDKSINWLDASKSLLIDLQNLGKRFKSEGNFKDDIFELSFGKSHPLYRIYREALGVEKKPYAWYVRVADMGKFVTHLTPLFETRLANSELNGWSGEVKLSFYKNGLQMTFEQGELKSATSSGFIDRKDASAHYHDLTFQGCFSGRNRSAN